MRVFSIGEFHGDVVHMQKVGDVVFAMTRRKKGEIVSSHTHDHAAIIALSAGNHHFIADSGKIKNSIPNAWYFSDPNQVHSHEACQSDIESIGIQFDSKSYPNPKLTDSSVLRGSSAEFIFHQIKEHLVNPRSTSTSILTANFELLRALIADEGQLIKSNVPDWLHNLKLHLNEHFLEPISVEQLGLQFGVHPSHMARSFRTEFGQTITSYTRDRKLEWCLNEMKSSSTKLGIVAARAGFADQSHFTREFIKRYGHKPSKFIS